jgi:hypothetical protein
MKPKDSLNETEEYVRLYYFPEVLNHDEYYEEVHAYAAKIAPFSFIKINRH